jgi:hypothetical protein
MARPMLHMPACCVALSNSKAALVNQVQPVQGAA